jgi:PadR family transcriptional regulator, regulatory protein PadR
MYGYATGAYPPTPHDALRKQAAFASRRDRENFSGVLPQRESECTMSNEEPKRASVTPPGNTFGIGCRPINWLEAVILLSLKEWSSYGYELMGRARVFGFEAMNTGTLYRTLRQMEKDGVLESSWETSGGGPARRMYTITGSGSAHLGIWVRSLERYQQSMDDFFKLYGSKLPYGDENEDD